MYEYKGLIRVVYIRMHIFSSKKNLEIYIFLLFLHFKTPKYFFLHLYQNDEMEEKKNKTNLTVKARVNLHIIHEDPVRFLLLKHNNNNSLYALCQSILSFRDVIFV